MEDGSLRTLLALFALGLMLAGCGAGPAAPTTGPALPATVTPPNADSGGSPATPSIALPLVPAFPTSTVAFSNAGPLAASLPFALPGGTYHVSWNAQPIGPGWALPTWDLVAAIHDPAGPTHYHLLFRLSLPATGAHEGTAVVPDIPAGTYVLDVAAAATCTWTVSIHP